MLGFPIEESMLTKTSIHYYIEDCERTFHRAIGASTKSVMEPTLRYHVSEKYGSTSDALGNTWWMAPHVEDVSHEEEERGIKKLGL